MENKLKKLLKSLPEKKFKKLKPLSEQEIKDALDKYSKVLKMPIYGTVVDLSIFYK